jgi:quercetin dioxygenase-like cupin family protein
MKGAPPGIMISPIRGDATKGRYAALIKFPVGLKVPLHYHRNNIKIVVIQGAYIYTPKGEAKQRFGSGSFVSYPGGDKHSTNSDESTETIFYLEQPGKFDLNVI